MNPHSHHRRHWLLGLGALGLQALASRAQAQAASSWPEKSVTVIVPFPAGGATDATARALALQMQTITGQTFVIENKPGATGAIGAAMVKRAPADGYTLMVSSLGTFVIAPHLQKSLPYDPLRDFDYISIPVQAPNVLVAAPAKTARSVADVIAELKANPGKVSFSSSGNGASDHISAEVFWQQTGTDGLHIPYKGGAPAISDLLGNQVDYSFPNVNAVIGHIKSGKLRPLAVTSSKRSPVLPDVPTLAEAGVKDAEIYSWQGLTAPRGLPAPVLAKISSVAIAAMRDPAVHRRMTEQGLEVVANTPAEFTAFQAREFARWKKLIEERGIKAD